MLSRSQVSAKKQGEKCGKLGPGRASMGKSCMALPACICMLSHFNCVRLFDAMDHHLLDSSDHRILQARILEWDAMPSSRGSY